MRSGSVISCGLGGPESPPCVSPTVNSSSYVREMLQVSKDGGTVSGNGTFSHSQEGTTHTTFASSFELPIRTVMFDLLVSIQLLVSRRRRP
jgi:hypothetical protein